MKLRAAVTMAALLFTPFLASADPLSDPLGGGRTSTTPKKPVEAMTDAQVDEKKKALEKVLAKRNEQAAKEALAAQKLEAKAKDDRAAFEKKQIADRKAFLDGLKKEPDQKKRLSALTKFNNQEVRERRKFFGDQMNARWELNQSFQKERMMSVDEMVETPKKETKPAPASAAKPAPASKPAAAKPAAKKS